MTNNGPARRSSREQRQKTARDDGTLIELVESLEQRCRLPAAARGPADPALHSGPLSAESLVGEATLRLDTLPLLERASTQSRRSSQRDRGAFATPIDLARRMSEWVFADAAVGNAVILDPACGAGQLLVAAARCLLARFPGPTKAHEIARVRAQIRGVELDPTLARAARLALRLLWGDTDEDTSSLDECVLTADALPMGRHQFATTEKSLWVLANPPFVGVTENGFHTPADASSTFRVLASANQAAHFWDRIDQWCSRPGDRYVALIPRNLLVGDGTARLRREIDTDLREVWLLTDSQLFNGAIVSVVVVAVERSGAEVGALRELKIVETSDPAGTVDERVHARPVTRLFEWWPTIVSLDHGLAPDEDTGDFEVRAGLITSDAYLLRPLIAEWPSDADRSRYRLLTSGLIDPGISLWGTVPCRFLGGRWQRPVVSPPAEREAWLQRVIERSHRPKLIVAGLGRRFECVLDEIGDYVPSVGTWVVYHRTDNVAELVEMSAEWARRDVDAWMQAELGANAMNGGSITLTRPFMRRLVATGLAARPVQKF